MIQTIIVTAVIMAGLDYAWLHFASSFFFRQIGHLARTQNGTFDVAYLPAIFTYLLMVLGLILFVYPLAKNNPLQALLYGGLFGLIMFGIYEGTNAATLRDWPWKMVVVDMIWGTILCGVTAALTVFIINKI